MEISAIGNCRKIAQIEITEHQQNHNQIDDTSANVEVTTEIVMMRSAAISNRKSRSDLKLLQARGSCLSWAYPLLPRMVPTQLMLVWFSQGGKESRFRTSMISEAVFLDWPSDLLNSCA